MVKNKLFATVAKTKKKREMFPILRNIIGVGQKSLLGDSSVTFYGKS